MHPDRAIALNNLAASIHQRFQQRGDPMDIDQAVQLHREALTLLARHPDRSTSLNNLDSVIVERFKQRGDPADIDEAVQLGREALASRPAPHPDRSSSLTNLAYSIHHRFEQRGDPMDINEAVELHREALALRPAVDPDRSNSLNDLANSIHKRFQRWGDPLDSDEAIQLHREALALRPAPHPERASSLNNLAASVHGRFQHQGDPADIDEAIQLHREALALSPSPHPDRGTYLNNLAALIHERFQQRGDPEDIDETIQLYREALNLRPEPHPQRAGVLSNLAGSIRRRFEQRGDPADIDAAVQLHREALALLPAPHPDHPSALNNLANSILERFRQRGDLSDIDESVQLNREALVLRPAPHPDRDSSLNNLANAAVERFEQQGDPTDINEAVELHREALALRPAPHPDRSSSLNNLANAAFRRFEHWGNSTDIDEAVELHREALTLRPAPHPDRADSLNNLANSMHTRFEKRGNLADLEEAIQLHREALVLTPAPHPERASYLNNLGLSLASLYEQTAQVADLTSAILALQEGSTDPLTFPLVRFRAAKTWSSVAHKHHHPSALDAYETALCLLPRLAALSLDAPSRQAILVVARSNNLGSDAAACAINRSQYNTALELLEAGCSVFWSQSLQLRTSLDDLRVSDPLLATKLTELSRQLEQSSFREASRNLRPAGHPGLISVEAEAANCQRLNEKWDETVQIVRSSVAGFEDFMQPRNLSKLRLAAARGPVVILTAGSTSCHALILDSLADVQCVPLSADITRGSIEFLSQTLQALVSTASFSTFVAALPKRRHDMNIPDRLMGRLEGEDKFDPDKWFRLYDEQSVGESVSDYVISSYTPTLAALLAPPFPQFTTNDHLKTTVVIQPNTPGCSPLPKTEDELRKIQENIPEKWLTAFGTVESPASVDRVLPHLLSASILHFACHGVQDADIPLQSALVVGNDRLTVSRIMKQSGVASDTGSERLEKHMGLAFLSACQTAMGDKKLPDEAIHLAATLLFAGFRSVVATMWTMQDADGPEVAEAFYGHLFRNADPTSDPPVFPDLNESAKALHLAVKKLREKVPLARWVPFVHYGL
ncbi:CHAT domain-containing protein [Mycena epipterygia]|nr:CHAT domain-containing protein [Mycena epipterygia]